MWKCCLILDAFLHNVEVRNKFQQGLMREKRCVLLCRRDGILCGRFRRVSMPRCGCNARGRGYGVVLRICRSSSGRLVQMQARMRVVHIAVPECARLHIGVL